MAVAKSLVSPTGVSTVCRILNPTNAPMSLRAHTAVATIEPIDPHHADNRKILTRSSRPRAEFINTLSNTPNVTHEDRCQALKSMGCPSFRDFT